MLKAAPIMLALGLAGCAAPALRPMPLAASGPAAVTLEGQAFMADLQPTTSGAQILLSREGTPLALDEGLLAKKAVLQFCAQRGQSLDPRALGEFQHGLWVFDGGCA